MKFKIYYVFLIYFTRKPSHPHILGRCEFVKKMKREGFSTPQEWIKAKLGLDDI